MTGRGTRHDPPSMGLGTPVWCIVQILSPQSPSHLLDICDAALKMGDSSYSGKKLWRHYPFSVLLDFALSIAV